MTLGRLTTTLCACAVLLTASAFASSSLQRTVRATIPFAFDLQGKPMPAGLYEISGAAADSYFTLRTPDGHVVAVLTMPAGDPAGVKSPGLVFRHTSRGYRLAEVRLQEGVAACGIPLTREEAVYAASRRDSGQVEILFTHS
jgi:hypothetical protein